MGSAHRPAALVSKAADEIEARRDAVRSAHRRGWPAPKVYSADPLHPEVVTDQLLAAIDAGQHDALLITLPVDPGPTAGLLQACTRQGVEVSFLPPPRRVSGQPPGPDLGDLQPAETWDVLAKARLEALEGLFPGWRIWLDRRGWHARRRDGDFLQGYRPGAPAFHVVADTATDLAAQLCWQKAADVHAPDGCYASTVPPPPWKIISAAGGTAR
jgi:hypothetical protein